MGSLADGNIYNYPKKMREKSRLWLIFFLVLVLASPLLEGGETYHTIIWLRLWVIGFALYYFLKPIREGRLEFISPRGSWIFILLLILSGTSFITSHYYYITVYHFSNLLVYFLLFFLVLGILFQEQKLVEKLLLILILALVLEVIFGFFEYFRLHPSRVRGSFFNPAYYAGYLLALIPFPLYALFYHQEILGERGRRFLLQLGLGIIFLAGLFALLSSGSRVAIFSVIPLGVVFLVRYRWRAILLLGVLLLGIIFIPNPFQKRLKSINRDPYAWERITIWKTSLRMIQHHPFGVGLGMYKYYYNRYAYPVRMVEIGRYGKEAHRAHNEILHYACECGVIFPVLALGFLSWVFFLGFKFIFQPGKGGSAGLSSAFFGSFLGIFFHSLVDSNLHQPPIMVLGVVDLAVLFYLFSERYPAVVRKSRFKLNQPGFLQVFLLVSGFFLAGLISYQALIAGFYFEAIKTPQLEKRYQKLVRLTRFPSGYAPLYYQLAMDAQGLFFQKRSWALALQAIKYFQYSLKLNPENYLYYHNYGEFLYQFSLLSGKRELMEEAERLVKKALDLAPGRVFGYSLLAEIYLKKGELSQAEQWLRKGLSYEPYYLRAGLLLVKVLWEQGKKELAEQEYQELVRAYQYVTQELASRGSVYNFYQLSLVRLNQEELLKLRSLLGLEAEAP